MLSIFQKISDLWNNYGFTFLLVAALFFILFYWFFWGRHKQHGSYSDKYSYQFENAPNYPKYPKYTQQSPDKKKKREKYPHPVPNCSFKDSKGEIACREYLQNRFQRPFPKRRPKFMFNSVTGSNLELDMFNKELRIACEYNGRQHYEYVPYLHGNSKENFYAQKYRDKMKEEICQKLGIFLIKVPYTVKEDKIPDFLENELSVYPQWYDEISRRKSKKN
jgi:hypothetical protein